MTARFNSRSLQVWILAALVASSIPAVASETSAEPTRLSIGFHDHPMTFAQGDLYDGASIALALPALRSMSVLTLDPEGFRARQLEDPNVRYVETMETIQLLLREELSDPGALFTPNDPSWTNTGLYGIRQIRADKVWDTTLGDGDAAVCVVDTGVRRTHQDLGTARYLGGYDFVNNDADPADDQGHGTHVAGTAVGAVNNGIGLAGVGNTNYYAVKVLDSGGSGSWDNVAAGVNWCADNGVARTVISLSLGGGGGASVLADAVHYAFASKGKLVVAASGNGFCDNCVGYPAAYPEAIAVGCTTDTQASCDFTSKGPQVDVAAPGSNTYSTCFASDTDYCVKSGTSMSTPHASGALALVWSHLTTLSASELWARLNATAVDLGEQGPDNAFGHGRVDALCLLDGGGTGCGTLPLPPLFPSWVENFNAGSPGWTTTGLWHLSTCRSNSTAQALAYNKAGCPTNFDTGVTNSGEAISPSIAIPPGVAAAKLRFASWYQTEAGTTWDKKTVAASANGGAFSTIFQESGEMTTWNLRTLDLTPYAGQLVKIRFTFNTGDATANTGEGWYVDDVTLLTTTPPIVTLPSEPLGLSATAGAGAGEITLSWSPPADNGNGVITAYKIYRANDASGPYTLVASNEGAITHVDSGLGDGVTRHYKVSAVNSAGEGPQSTSANARTFTLPGAPTATDAEPGGRLLSIDLTWDAPADNGGTPVSLYRVYRDSGSGYSYLASSDTTSYRDLNLDPTGVYHYFVTAVNIVGEGAESTDACARPAPWPALLQDTCEIALPASAPMVALPTLLARE